jgi:flavin-dependent dehydrogenase
MNRFSVIILGGGPAGAATALSLLNNGYSVLILERSLYEDWRVGETLPPHVQTLLGSLGLWDHFLRDGHLPSPAILAAWGSAHLFETHFIFNPYGLGWHLDRMRFDAMLTLAAEDAGATVWRGAHVKSVSPANQGWQLFIEGGEAPLCLEASFLVDATGRSSWLARSLGRKRISYDTMIGLVGVLRPQTSRTSVDPVLQLEATKEGWWYSAPVPDGSLIVTYITDRDYLTGSGLRHTLFWLSELERTSHTVGRCRGFQIEGDVRVKSASTYRLERPAGDGWVAVGDAASTYDPLSAEGVSKALRSGISAAQTIHHYLIGNREVLDEYVVGVAKEFENYLAQRVRYYCREMRWPTSLFWSRRQTNPLNLEGENFHHR